MIRLLTTTILAVLLLTILSCSDSNSPINLNDIETDTPANQGIDAELLEDAHQAASLFGFVNAILVARNGILVSEKYFRGTDENSHHNIRMVSQSFTSALIGIAIDKGYIPGVDKKIINYFPEYYYDLNDSRFNDITIEQLLNMESGLDIDKKIYWDVFYSDNWLDQIFTQYLEFSPGTGVKHSTASTHLLSVALSRAVDQSLKEFAEENLFGPMGIIADSWNRDPQGNYFSGSDLEFQPREMLKFGMLYQNKGTLNGTQIIPEEWINDTFTKGYQGTGTWGAWDKIGFGYLWWRGEINGYEILTAMGYGGQYIMLVPEINLTIVTACNSKVDWDRSDFQEKQIIDIIADYILPAVN